MEKVTAYKCKHCGKLYQRAKNCEKHETRCKKNPDNFRACFGCKHLEKVNKTYLYDTPYGEQGHGVEVLKCKKFEKLVYPPLVEHKNNAFDFGDIDNVPMPKTCSERIDDFIMSL